MTDMRATDAVIAALPIAGSGNPIAALESIRDTLALCTAETWQQLHERLPSDAGYGMLILGVLSDARLIDYGVAITYPWRTDLGDQVLARLTEKLTDEDASDLYYEQIHGVA